MKANELRIGNYVGFGVIHTGLGQEKSFAHYTVNQITETCMFFVESHAGEYFKDVQPIPLTEEWLRKFGFKYQNRDVSHGNGKIERFWSKHWFTGGDNWWIEINLNPITKDSNGFFWLNWNIGGGNDFVHLPHSCELKYIHQLQNLYFALTGNELEIK
jgi:hypothetical protein